MIDCEKRSCYCNDCVDEFSGSNTEFQELLNKNQEMKDGLWEAYQFIGAYMLIEHPEQDCIDIMDILTRLLCGNKENTVG